MALSEFRFNRRRKHPSYVFKKKNNKYHSILITHASKTGNKKNVKLYQNPKPNDNTEAYLVPKVYKDDVSSYNRPYNGWRFHTYDRRNVKRIKRGK